MPAGEPGGATTLIPPATRVVSRWQQFWRHLIRDNRRNLDTAKRYSAGLRHLR